MANSRLGGCFILVVEDEPLVCLEVVEMLTACGGRIVSAFRIADAIRLVELHQISAAVLDINLGGEDCSVLCEHLSKRRIPFAFYTGYATAPDGWGAAPVIKKPAHRTEIVDTVESLCRSHQQAA